MPATWYVWCTVIRVDVLRRAYELFNERRIDELLALMADDVEWPDVANAAVLHTKSEIRKYWEAQFAAAQPFVHPDDFVEDDGDVVAVVQQHVEGLDGAVVVPVHVVHHRYTFDDRGRVVRMTVSTPDDDVDRIERPPAAGIPDSSG